MSTLTVFKFATESGAEHALSTLDGLQKQHLIKILDAATVVWPEGKKKPRTRQLYNVAAAGAMGGTFWGMLFGMIFFLPFLGAAIGAAIGAMSGSFADIGIDDRFINDVKTKVTPGTSALFLMSTDAVVDRVTEAFKGQSIEVIASNLSSEQEAKLNAYFGEE